MAVLGLLYERSLYQSQPPGLQTKAAMNPTLLVSWWCTGFACVVILIRVAGRYIRTEQLFREDKIMFWSMVPLLMRMALVHVILIWGTNNTVTTGLTPTEIHHRQIGSKLVLVARILYAAYIWIAKLTVVQFLKRLIGASWHKSYEIGMRVIEIFLGLTFVGVIIATLVECHPFSHYWQVTPDPGPKCREGIAQLLTMGVCDIVTDLVLVVFPIPLVLMSAMPLKRKISLILLFLLSLTLVAVTAYRVPSTVARKSAQQYRSLLASLEILAATAVANVIVIGSFLRDRGIKKAKFKTERSRTNSVVTDGLEREPTRSKSISMAHWGSDEDLVRDMGMSLQPSLQHRNTSEMASMTPAFTLPSNDEQDDMLDERGRPRRTRLTRSDSVSSGSTTDFQEEGDAVAAPAPEDDAIESTTVVSQSAPASRKVSFFDVGGLVDSSERPPTTTSTTTPPNGGSRDSSIKDLALQQSANGGPTSVSRSSSRAFLTDVGGSSSSGPARLRQEEPGDVAAPPSSRRQDRAVFDAIPEHLGVSSTQSPASTKKKTASRPDDLDISDAGGLLG